MIKWFFALYKGECTACGMRFSAGDEIGYVDSKRGMVGGRLVGRECCAGNGLRSVKELIPYGKTSADRCSDCFIIHATGQTQCE